MLDSLQRAQRLLDFAYIAGAIDSDGWFSIGKVVGGKNRLTPSYFPLVGLTQATPQIPNLCREYFGGVVSVKEPHSGSKDIRATKPLYDWRVSGALLRPCLDEIMPFLRVKADRARVVYALRVAIDTYNGSRQGIDPEQAELRESLYLAFKAAVR